MNKLVKLAQDQAQFSRSIMEEKITSECPPNTGTSTQPAIEFDIKVEVKVESCDEDYSIKGSECSRQPKLLETKKEEIVAKELIKLQNRNSKNHSDPDKSNRLKLAYLQAIKEKGVLKNLQESGNSKVKIQSTAEQPETFQSLVDKIKKELIDEDENQTGQNLDNHSVLEKSNELRFAYLIKAFENESVLRKLEKSFNNKIKGLSIEEKPETIETLIDQIKKELLEDLSFIEEELIENQNQSLKSIQIIPENSNESCKTTDLNKLISKENPCDIDDSDTRCVNVIKVSETLINNSAQDNSVKKEVPNGDHELPPLCGTTKAILSSSYIDLALKISIALLKNAGAEAKKYYCDLCEKDFVSDGTLQHTRKASINEFRSHLNCSHLNDCFNLTIEIESKNSGTIIAEKVNETNHDYMQLMSKVSRDMYLRNMYSQIIVCALYKVKEKELLSYKCYVCKLCYEHLGPFLEHLTMHDRFIKIKTEVVEKRFVNIKAYDTTSYYEDFRMVLNETNSDYRFIYKCLKCKANFKTNKLAYEEHSLTRPKCLGCKRSLYCHQEHNHTGHCKRYFETSYPKTCPCFLVFANEAELNEHQDSCLIGRSQVSFTCWVCRFVATTAHLLACHQRLCHTVRSDEIILSDHMVGSPPPWLPTKYMAWYIRETIPLLPVERKPFRSFESKQVVENSPEMLRKTKKKILMNRGLGTCLVCKFEGTDDCLAAHMVTNHLVRSDVRIEQCSFEDDAMRQDAHHGEDKPILRETKPATLMQLLPRTHPVCKFKETENKQRIPEVIIRQDAHHCEDKQVLRKTNPTTCHVCKFEGTEDCLAAHMVTKRSVRSDVRIKQCFKNKHARRRKQILRKTKPTIRIRTCPVCMFEGTESRLAAHMVTKHLVRSDLILEQCSFKEDDRLAECYYCFEKIESHLLSIHLKAHKISMCTRCNRNLQFHCEVTCERMITPVYKCIKCGIYEDSVSAISSHCAKCFCDANKVFCAIKVFKKFASLTDIAHDHCYATSISDVINNFLAKPTEPLKVVIDVVNDYLVEPTEPLAVVTDVINDPPAEPTELLKVLNDAINEPLAEPTEPDKVVTDVINEPLTEPTEPLKVVSDAINEPLTEPTEPLKVVTDVINDPPGEPTESLNVVSDVINYPPGEPTEPLKAVTDVLNEPLTEATQPLEVVVGQNADHLHQNIAHKFHKYMKNMSTECTRVLKVRHNEYMAVSDEVGDAAKVSETSISERLKLKRKHDNSVLTDNEPKGFNGEYFKYMKRNFLI